MSTLVGWAVFSEFPDAWTWVGVSILIASAVYISLPQRGPT
jgi:drug/metabolite transporter (DMT)-like permease